MTTERGTNNTATRKTIKRNDVGSEQREIANEQLMEAINKDCHRGFMAEGCCHVGTPRYE